ncbi:hypothetical protein GNI_018260 [Gregarina niphandrodes]|uniref:Uncharacterized protein n=1 Tax=Gregarina niphandrodes TaxID=110365 RepID=A0A023BC62_GRENI|nr:hypothetical protein GNI_018260 [Gregarina niphandrodes]EZG81684.1 hypothetical protein GNI_018260 [Gregarina niphandrodes]|eukprot:XP_011134190.1 hypothetical protein GNI_018260 [Gregarina niphandrodes]
MRTLVSARLVKQDTVRVLFAMVAGADEQELDAPSEWGEMPSSSEQPWSAEDELEWEQAAEDLQAELRGPVEEVGNRDAQLAAPEGWARRLLGLFQWRRTPVRGWLESDRAERERQERQQRLLHEYATGCFYAGLLVLSAKLIGDYLEPHGYGKNTNFCTHAADMAGTFTFKDQALQGGCKYTGGLLCAYVDGAARRVGCHWFENKPEMVSLWESLKLRPTFVGCQLYCDRLMTPSERVDYLKFVAALRPGVVSLYTPISVAERDAFYRTRGKEVSFEELVRDAAAEIYTEVFRLHQDSRCSGTVRLHDATNVRKLDDCFCGLDSVSCEASPSSDSTATDSAESEIAESEIAAFVSVHTPRMHVLDMIEKGANSTSVARLIGACSNLCYKALQAANVNPFI